MATLMIGYDLNKQGNDYKDLIEAIKSLSNGSWWHNLDSTWLIITGKSAAEARDTLKSYLDSDDELLVIDVSGRARAWAGFSDKASTWLSETYT